MKTRQGKARRRETRGDKGRQRETKGDNTGDSGDKRDGEGREQATSMDISIYMKAEAEKALGETQRQHSDPAT